MSEILLSFAMCGRPVAPECGLSFAPLLDQPVKRPAESEFLPAANERYEWWVIDGRWVRVLVRPVATQPPAALPAAPTARYPYQAYRVAPASCGALGCR